MYVYGGADRVYGQSVERISDNFTVISHLNPHFVVFTHLQGPPGHLDHRPDLVRDGDTLGSGEGGKRVRCRLYMEDRVIKVRHESMSAQTPAPGSYADTRCGECGGRELRLLPPHSPPL